MRRLISDLESKSSGELSPLSIRNTVKRAFLLAWLPHEDDAHQAMLALKDIKIIHLNTIDTLHLYGASLYRITLTKNQSKRERLARKVFRKADLFLFQKLQLGGSLSTAQQIDLDVRLAIYLRADHRKYTTRLLNRLREYQTLDPHHVALLARLK
jgi:hypothetical protein